MKPLELVHLDISVKVQPCMSGSTMTTAFIDEVTENYDVMLIKNKYELPYGLMVYKKRIKKSSPL